MVLKPCLTFLGGQFVTLIRGTTIVLPIANNDRIKFFTFHSIFNEIGNFYHPFMLLSVVVVLFQAHIIYSVLKLYVLIQVVMLTVILQILHGLKLGRERRRIWWKRKITIGHHLLWKVGSILIN